MILHFFTNANSQPLDTVKKVQYGPLNMSVHKWASEAQHASGRKLAFLSFFLKRLIKRVYCTYFTCAGGYEIATVKKLCYYTASMGMYVCLSVGPLPLNCEASLPLSRLHLGPRRPSWAREGKLQRRVDRAESDYKLGKKGNSTFQLI